MAVARSSTVGPNGGSIGRLAPDSDRCRCCPQTRTPTPSSSVGLSRWSHTSRASTSCLDTYCEEGSGVAFVDRAEKNLMAVVPFRCAHQSRTGV
jgi:hypothetical protein